MAWFNAPIAQPDHRLRAVRAALAIRDAAQELHGDLPAGFHLEFGIGLHAGPALLGLVGTERRLEYTAIGDSVNTARRLQEHAAEGQILISRVTAQPVAELLVLDEAPSVQAEGKQEPVEVYLVRGLRGMAPLD
jgi:class 3 adenylate cyclase